MKKSAEGTQSRREFFAGALRYGALGLMASVSAMLFAKRRRLVRQGLCINSGICAGCEVLENCSLPPAVSARENLAGADNGKS